METKTKALSQESATGSLPWWKLLNRYQWFVFSMATMAWMFDCVGQQVFIIARNPAIKALMPPDTGADVLKQYGGYITAIFVAGWATGGLIFGSVGDRMGRARTLAVTVLLYAVFTALSAFSVGMIDFTLYRFLAGLGVGGVFGLSVALCADSLPDQARPQALGLLQSLSALGNVGAGLMAVALGYFETVGLKPGTSWRYLFVFGAVPALLCVGFLFRVKEPEKWLKARAEGKRAGVAFGSYLSLFGEARWRKPTLLGMILCIAGVVGLWGIGFFSPELVQDVIGKALQAEHVAAAQLPGKRMMWTGINMVMQNLGAFIGMIVFTKMALKFGRKPIFALASVCAFVATFVLFKFLSQPWHIFVLSPIMGFFQLALFAGFAIYLPELFPLRLRSTGTSFCYNVGRFVAASGPFTLGLLQSYLAAGLLTPEAKLDAFRNAACWISTIYLLGLLALPFLPETKGCPLPED